jgi:hypothetical protein
MAAGDEAFRQLVERARSMLSIDVSEASKRNLDERLERLAAELALEWIVGDRRFESQGQQTEYWLFRFYDEIFSDEQPDATRVYERFSLSLPRAAYVARILRARRTAHWREAARTELRAQLQRYKSSAEADKKANKAHIQEYDLSLSPVAADELRVLYDRISEFAPDHERPKPPRAKPAYGSARWMAVPALTLLLILDALDQGVARMTNANPLTTVSLMLTLAGLVGTFFNI